jgi:CheY-like chemotaxis protein
MNILVAEDEETIGELYQVALRAKGHEVNLTTNGRQCLDEYQSEPGHYDVVILDHRMPIMDGYDAALGILEINPHQRIIFASAYVQETLADLIKESGIIAEILTKPFEIDVLTDTVEDSSIYRKLQELQVNIGDLKQWNPTRQQISDLLASLVRLRDPATIFKQIEKELGPKATDSSNLHEQHDKRDDSRVVNGILQEALKYLGPEWLSIVYYHLDHLGIRRDEISDRPEQFAFAVEKMLGTASSMLYGQILRTIESNQNVIGANESVLRLKEELAARVRVNAPVATKVEERSN